MVKKLKYLLFLIPFLFITNVNAVDHWTGTNWASTSPSYIQVFGYRNEDGNITYPYNTYQPQLVSAFQFNGYQPNGFGGYAYNQVSGSGYSLLTYTNSINFVYENKQFTRDGDFVTLHGQIMPSNQQGINILDLLSWYVAVYYGADTPAICESNKGSVNGMYFADFYCSFPRTNYISISLNFTNYTGSNQGSTFMIRSDYSDVMYSNDNTGIITNSIGGASQDIINNNNSNTNQIIQNQDGNTQDIINNQNQNAQDIINNQNQNSQQQIESQQICKNSKNYSLIKDLSLNSVGSAVANSGQSTSDFIPIPKSIKILSTSSVTTRRLCFYDTNYSFISCISSTNYSAGDFISIPQNSSYLRFNTKTGQTTPSYSFCYNGNQALTDSITSDDAPNTSTELDNLDSSVASDTPISDLITLPITLANVFINGIEASCSPVNLGNLYGTDLILPCINIEQKLGSNLWSQIDILFSIFMCYNIGMLFITAFSGITSLRDDFDSLYQPKHADTGYQPKHGG